MMGTESEFEELTSFDSSKSIVAESGFSPTVNALFASKSTATSFLPAPELS